MKGHGKIKFFLPALSGPVSVSCAESSFLRLNLQLRLLYSSFTRSLVHSLVHWLVVCFFMFFFKFSNECFYIYGLNVSAAGMKLEIWKSIV